MSSVYTNLAKKRIEQSQEASQTPPKASEPQPIENSQQSQRVIPTTSVSKPLKRKQISAYLTQEELQKLKALHFTLNSNLTSDDEIEKSDIVALGIECLSQILSTQVPKYSNTQELRVAVLEQVSKYLSTQVPKS
jgi:hypothetical protein